jgi:hypothetical protein
MMLMESFGFCSWHARQIPALPFICAPDMGFSIFASDLLKKLDYVGRAVTEKYRKRSGKSWFRRKARSLLSLLKERSCPACDHVKQFESYYLVELMDAIGDAEFLDAYKGSQGLCLPHLFILEESHSSHTNFPFLLELQLAKARALRNRLEEFIRKQDFRLRDQITPQEAASWQTAIEILTGKPGMFAIEMGHDLAQRQGRAAFDQNIPLTRVRSDSHGLGELLAELTISKQVTLCLTKPLPADLLDKLKQLSDDGCGPTLEAIVENLDVKNLRQLHSAGLSLFYGIGLPRQSIILLDCKRGFLIEETPQNVELKFRVLKKAEDLYLRLVWHKFGIAALLSGFVKETDARSRLFCLAIEGKREQWCRFRDSVASEIPQVGINVEIFGWEKWNSHIVEVLELEEVEAKEVTHK